MTRPHVAHTEGDKCPSCGLLWEQWPMAHKGDVVCGQLCEKGGPKSSPDEPVARP